MSSTLPPSLGTIWVNDFTSTRMPYPIDMPETMTQKASDPYAAIKEQQKKGWALFTPMETFTVGEAAHLVSFAGVQPGQAVLDVGTGTGVVAITAAQRGATVTGLDLTPELLVRAREHSAVADLDKAISWQEGDAEALPFPDASFDVVVSEFGHMFAPRHDLAMAEMLRVLKPGGTIAFSTWPPHLFVGQTFRLVGRHMPPPPPGLQVGAPAEWGRPEYIQERLGDRVRDVTFDTGLMRVPALTTRHFMAMLERSVGPVAGIVKALQDKPQELAAFRREYASLIDQYRRDNVVYQDYLMTRAIKR